LTPREYSVLKSVAAGLRNKEIAAVMNISEETVRVHVRNILGKRRTSWPAVHPSLAA
jgi:two-component system nitrate/nitrite response regulator NarP